MTCVHGVEKKQIKEFKFTGRIVLCKCCKNLFGTLNSNCDNYLCSRCQKEEEK